MSARARVTTIALALGALGSCRCDTFRFYDVVRERTEECDIMPQGELCDEPEGFAPPVTEVWAVEHVGAEIRVYVDEEVWVANVQNPDDSPDFVTADKLEVSSREPGPCTTTRTRGFAILATYDPLTGAGELTGEIAERAVIEGPEQCGDTPTGLRTRARLDGIPAGAP